MSEIKKGDMVSYRDKNAKVIGISVKGGKTKYKLKLKDSFNTIIYNIDSKEINKLNNDSMEESEETNMEEVKVYVDCLDGDNRGDLVRCSDCGELMLIQIGGTACGECESENLQWYDDNRPEWTIAELEEAGFIVIEK